MDWNVEGTRHIYRGLVSASTVEEMLIGIVLFVPSAVLFVKNVEYL